MNGEHIKQLRKKLGMTQSELARCLEISPVTVNRWECGDPRYSPPAKETRLLEALGEIAERSSKDEFSQLKDVLRVTTISGVVGKLAVSGLLPATTTALLAATPGLGWLGLLCGVGIGASLPFFAGLKRGADTETAGHTKKTSVRRKRRLATTSKAKQQ